MGHKPIELILLRQLASRLPLPVTLVDAEGVVVYVNPYRRLHEWIEYRHADRSPMTYEDRPLAVALDDRRPHQTTIILHGADGVPHRVEVMAIPLDGQGGSLIGAMSVFWEAD